MSEFLDNYPDDDAVLVHYEQVNATTKHEED